MPRVPAVSILSEAAVDQDGITFTKIYPTLKLPSTYDRDGYKFFAIKEAPFVLTDQDHSVTFHIYGQPRPQKRGFRSGVGNHNHFSSSKADQDELASVHQVRQIIYNDFFLSLMTFSKLNNPYKRLNQYQWFRFLTK